MLFILFCTAIWKVEARDLNYAAVDAEMAALQRHVKAKSNTSGEGGSREFEGRE